MSTVVAEPTKKYKLSFATVYHLARILDAETNETVLYHKLDVAYSCTWRTVLGLPATVKLTCSEVQMLRSVIRSRLEGEHYTTITIREMLKVAWTALER